MRAYTYTLIMIRACTIRCK